MSEMERLLRELRDVLYQARGLCGGCSSWFCDGEIRQALAEAQKELDSLKRES